jgi:hypothetical protein
MTAFSFFIIAAINLMAYSQASDTPPPSLQALLEVSCQEEIKRLCPTEEGPRSILRCLKTQQEQMSSKCKEDMSRVFQSNQEVSHRGGGALSSFGGFGMTPSASPSIAYEGRIAPNHNSPSLSENKIVISTPLYKAEGKSLSLSTQGNILHLNQPLLLSPGTIIPKDYYRMELGAHYLQMLPEKRSFGVRSSLGYNTDKPLTDKRDLSFSLSGHYSFPSTDHSSWAVALYLSNNGPLANYIPIPGVIYFYKTPTLTGMFGFPFASLQWTPAFPWTLSTSLFGFNYNFEIAYGSVERSQYLFGLNSGRQSYMLHNRVDEKERLTFEEKKLFLGLRTPLFNKVSSEFQIGDSFGRKVYLGNKLFKKNGGETKMNSSLYASWRMRTSF